MTTGKRATKRPRAKGGPCGSVEAMTRTKASHGLRAPSPRYIYQLRVALRYIQPPIWRRVLVPDNWRLGDLHPVLAVMGWGGYHLHAFRFGGGFNPTEYSTHQMVMECGPRVLDEDQVLLVHDGKSFQHQG
jgi:hypothetical protein